MRALPKCKLHNRGFAFIITSTLLALAASAGADQVVLQNGLDSYAGTEDVTLVQSTSVYNFGNTTNLSTRNVGSYSGWYTSLIKFDVSAIPAGATIESATLSLYNSSKGNGTARVYAFRMKRSWVEGNGDGSWNYGRASGATYLGYDRSLTEVHNWDSRPDGAAGARGTGDAESTYASSGNWTESNTWINFDVTSDVQAWSDGADNFGWTLRESTYNIAPSFYSSEYTDASLRPMLTISYVPEPATTAIICLGALAALRKRKSIKS